MAPASPISTTTTSLRQSVVVSRSDRFRAAGSVESPTWIVVHQNLPAGSKTPQLHSIPQPPFPFYRYVSVLMTRFWRQRRGVPPPPARKRRVSQDRAGGDSKGKDARRKLGRRETCWLRVKQVTRDHCRSYGK